MPSFTGNLKTIGIEARPGLQPYLRCEIEGATAGVRPDGDVVAGTREFYPDEDGDFTLDLATTIDTIPYTRVQITGGWLGEDDYFDLPPFPVPNSNGTIADLMSMAGVTLSGLWAVGLGPWPDWFTGFMWINLATDPATAQVREY